MPSLLKVNMDESKSKTDGSAPHFQRTEPGVERAVTVFAAVMLLGFLTFIGIIVFAAMYRLSHLRH